MQKEQPDSFETLLEKLIKAAESTLRKIVGKRWSNAISYQVLEEAKTIVFQFGNTPRRKKTRLIDAFLEIAAQIGAIFDSGVYAFRWT